MELPKQIRDRLNNGAGCDVSIHVGWIGLIVELDHKLSINNPNYTINQIKEKFGGLRFYVSGVNPEDRKLIEEAEHKSFTMCEYCGKDGTVQMVGTGLGNTWRKVVCNTHKDQIP